MKIKITGLQKLDNKLNKIEKSFFTKKVMGRIASVALDHIKQRTLRGRDMYGRAFKPYTDKYREYRKERGRSVKKVNLDDYGHMQGAIKQKERHNYAEIYMGGVKEEGLKAKGLHRKRKWFGVGKRYERKLKAVALIELRMEMRKQAR